MRFPVPLTTFCSRLWQVNRIVCDPFAARSRSVCRRRSSSYIAKVSSRSSGSGSSCVTMLPDCHAERKIELFQRSSAERLRQNLSSLRLHAELSRFVHFRQIVFSLCNRRDISGYHTVDLISPLVPDSLDRRMISFLPSRRHQVPAGVLSRAPAPLHTSSCSARIASSRFLLRECFLQPLQAGVCSAFPTPQAGCAPRPPLPRSLAPPSSPSHFLLHARLPRAPMAQYACHSDAEQNGKNAFRRRKRSGA